MKKFFKKPFLMLMVIFMFASVMCTSAAASVVEPKWTSGEGETHRYIVEQALRLVNKDKGSEAGMQLLTYKDKLLKYCDMPDKDEIWWGNAYHFYNPHTGYNYYPWPAPESVRKKTAMVMFLDHSKAARRLYLEGNIVDSYEKLGRAIHYLEDVNTPHHAANKIAVISNHTQFESFVLETQSSYRAEKGTKYDLFTNLKWDKYCEKLLHDSALYAYDRIDLASYDDGTDKENEAKWAVAAEATIEHAQEAVAAYLYNFLKEVNAIK